MYDDCELVINKNINICFLSGTIISEPDFNFFYNSKRFVSKVEFLFRIGDGFCGFGGNDHGNFCDVKLTAYNEKADFIYKCLDIGDKIVVKGFLEKEKVVVEDIFS